MEIYSLQKGNIKQDNTVDLPNDQVYSKQKKVIYHEDVSIKTWRRLLVKEKKNPSAAEWQTTMIDITELQQKVLVCAYQRPIIEV